jgi:hypothetical protein
MRHRLGRFIAVIASVLVLALVGALPVAADDSSPTLTSLKTTFFVVPETDASAGATSSMAIATAEEIRKAVKPLSGNAPWIVPEQSWRTADLVAQCAADPMAIGGVVVTFYTGAASHFYLLYQSETQTWTVTAELVACNRSADGKKAAPTIVGIIGELPGAHGTPWVVRRSQVSIPLISFAGLATLLSTKSSSTTTTTSNITTAAVFSSLVGQATDRDIPGYSTPLKLRYGSAEVGVDLVRAMRDLCTTHKDLPAADSADARDKLCDAFGFTRDPAEVEVQQRALDALEAAEREQKHR